MLSKLDFTGKFRAQIFPQFFLEQSLAGISVIIIIIIMNNNNLLFARLQITFKYDLTRTNKNKIYKIIRINLSISTINKTLFKSYFNSLIPAVAPK